MRRAQMAETRGGSWRAAAAAEGVLVLAALLGCAPALRSTRVAYTWGAVDFVFQSDQQRQQLIDNGSYVPGNAVPFGVNVHPDSGRVFVTLPSVLEGTPVSVATIENVKQVDSPRLVPYPDWSWHAGARGCDGLTSVFRSAIDRCGRLWLIDSGVVDAATTFEHRCPPKLVVFNLTTNELLLQHTFSVPEGCNDYLLLNLLVDQLGDKCSNNVFAYVTDTSTFAIYVYSMSENRSWRVTSELFFPDVNAREMRIDGIRWTLMDGVQTLAHDGHYLYFHALNSYQEGRVPLSVMRNEQLFTNATEEPVGDQFKFIGRRLHQSGGETMSSNNILFFFEVEVNTIHCWDTRFEYNKRNHIPVEEDRKRLNFVSDMRIVPRKSYEEVWAVSNSAHRVFTGQYSANRTGNVYVIRGKIGPSLGLPCYMHVLSPS